MLLLLRANWETVNSNSNVNSEGQSHRASNWKALANIRSAHSKRISIDEEALTIVWNLFLPYFPKPLRVVFFMVHSLYCAEVTPLVGPEGLVNPSSTDTQADSAELLTSFESQTPSSLCVLLGQCAHTIFMSHWPGPCIETLGLGLWPPP